MGVVSRQGTWNAINLGLGVLVGALSTIVIFPYVFKDHPENWGNIQVVLSYSFLLSQFLIVGVPHIAVRFMPKFKSQKEEGFITSLVLFFPLIMVAIFMGVYWLWPDLLLDLVKEEERTVIQESLIYLVLLTAALTWFKCLVGFSNAHYRSVFPMTLSEIFVRVSVLGGVGLFYYEYYSFQELLWHYVVVYGLQALLLGLSLLNKFKLPNFSISRKQLGEVSSYGLFATFDGAATTLLQYLDILMLAYFVPLEDIAYFTLGMFIGALVQIPARAMSSISMPLISKAWHDQNMEELKVIYQKTSLTQMVLGAIIILLIVFNLESLFSLLPEEFSPGIGVAIFIGMARFINISAGVNGNIIVMSKKFIYNFYFNITLLVLTFLTNLWLIPEYGILGAAIGTCISLFLFNLIKAIFVYVTMGMQPFGRNHLFCLLISGVVAAIGYFLPHWSDNAIIDIAYVGGIMFTVYALSTYFLNVSPDINEMVDKLLRRFKLMR